MKEVKCECGHVNPHGTVFCESCGKTLIEEKTDKKLLDMRYEGSARRSQTYNKTFIDKIWNFFSSVKVGVWLIVITLIASALGTVLPQEMYIPPIMPAAEYYAEQYGWFGRLYYNLGFNNLYDSWWFLILIASIGVSLVICSLDRVIPLYRALKKQRVTRHESFLKRQRLFGVTETQITDEEFTKVKENLQARRYTIREENGNLLAEKGRFSRWGPYVNHIGIIIFLIGAMLRFIPGMYIDEMMWLREGETKLIPGTKGEYYLENKKFQLEVYDKKKDDQVFSEALDRAGMVAKNYQSDVVLYKKDDDSIPGEEVQLNEVKEYSIQVNEPLKFNGYAVYQMDYKLAELHKMTFSLLNKGTSESFGSITIDLNNPQTNYDLGAGYQVKLLSYFPDFEFDADGEPATKSRVPNNPAFVFDIVTPTNPDGEVSFVAIQQSIEPFENNEYKMAFTAVETKNVTGLAIRKDMTLWILALGGFLFMVGVIQGSYWNHRRIWLRQNGDEIWIAAHTNKNWYTLKQEIGTILQETSIDEPADQLQEEEVK